MRILWIDDEPARWNCITNVPNWNAVISVDSIVFAHGHDQINHYLTCGIKWDYILLDGDMPLMSGVDVAKEFLCERNIPVIIVSLNPDKVKQIATVLDEYETPYKIASIAYPAAILSILRG